MGQEEAVHFLMILRSGGYQVLALRKERSRSVDLTIYSTIQKVGRDNEGTERANRGVVVGRKNHRGSRSARGTEIAAILPSLVESAKLVGGGPNLYLNTAITAALPEYSAPLPHETA